MAKIDYKVCVVTVTYGDRWKFLERVIQRVLSFNHLYKVIVVDNGSSYSVSSATEGLRDNRVVTLKMNENLGSAGGYKKGIQFASNEDCDFIWLLDDDNLPEDGCLDKLLEEWQLIDGNNDKKAVVCLREDRKLHVQIARGADPYRYYLVQDNFLGFSVKKILSNKVRKFIDKFEKPRALQNAKLPFCPYGGLLLHRTMIGKIGLPNEDYYLYVDDTEYSYRITESSGSIYLIPNCRVIDIDKSQGIDYKPGLLKSILLDHWNFRTYYHVRNMLVFNKKAIKNKYMFELNKNLYLGGLYILGVLNSRQEELKGLKEAIKDGLAENLGKKEFKNGRS